MATKKLQFDTRTCSRCGGTGIHSYRSDIGNRCLGCSGKGRVRTAPAKKAAAALEEWTTATASIPVTDLKEGDIVLHTSLGGTKSWETVMSVEEKERYASVTDGTVKYVSNRAIIYKLSAERGVQVHIYEGRSIPTVRRPMTDEEQEGRFAFAATLKGVSIIEEQA
jgi:hypothetical protein